MPRLARALGTDRCSMQLHLKISRANHSDSRLSSFVTGVNGSAPPPAMVHRGKIDLLIAPLADVCFVKFIREDLLLLPAVGTFADECFQILKLFKPRAVKWRTHGNLPFRSVSKERPVTLVTLQLLHDRQDCIVIGFLRDLLDQLGMPDDSFLIDHKNGPRQEPEFLDQHSVGCPERGVTVVREGLNPCHSGSPAPPSLGEWEVHADRQEDDIRAQTACFFVESPGL